jgi:hypothetical protein
MLYREIIAVCSEIHIKHINTLCGQNVEFVNIKSGGMYSDHCALHTVNVKSGGTYSDHSAVHILTTLRYI